MSTHKRTMAILAGLDDQGATIKRTSRGWQVLGPNGGIATLHNTPSDHRAELNLRSIIRKMGLEWPLDCGK